MPDSATQTPATISASQRRALFAAANSRGLSLEDLRALTPQHSVSRLTSDQAAALIDRLIADQRRFGAEFSPSRRRKPRRPSNVIALISTEQLELIRKLRISMGWTKIQLGDHFKNRSYPSDPSRTMDEMQTSRDAQAVIEHLKKILRRTLESHGTVVPPVSSDPRNRRRTIPQLMQSTPPFPRLLALLQLRRDDLAALGGAPPTETIDSSCCAGVACAIERLESQIAELTSKESAR